MTLIESKEKSCKVSIQLQNGLGLFMCLQWTEMTCDTSSWFWTRQKICKLIFYSQWSGNFAKSHIWFTMLANFAVSKLQYFHLSYLYSYEQFFDQELLSFFPIKIDMFFYLTFESFEFALRTKTLKEGHYILFFLS